MPEPTMKYPIMEAPESKALPEQSLLCSLLLSAIRDYVMPVLKLTAESQDGKNQQRSRYANRELERSNARWWIFQDDADDAYSFVGCCDWCDMNPYALREQLRRDPERVYKIVYRKMRKKQPISYRKQRDKAICLVCGRRRVLVAKGKCSACYSREYNRKGMVA